MNKHIKTKENVICVVGLGYVGLPLAESLSKYFKVIGFDVDKKKIEKLQNTYNDLQLTSNSKDIKKANFIIIAVPTPVTNHKESDMSYLIKAGETVGENLSKGSVVVLESTVYPGATEEALVPILEEKSSLTIGSDFKIGYSPERINPGDKINILGNITKIISGMDKETVYLLEKVYSKIVNVYKAENIRTAEAAKVIENIQRDLNISLMNELSIIFNKMRWILNLACSKRSLLDISIKSKMTFEKIKKASDILYSKDLISKSIEG